MVDAWKGLAGLALAAALAMPTAAANAAGETPRLTFTTLGTNSGPIPDPKRFEASSLVRYGDEAILVDAGDGAADQLARAGLEIGALKAVFISHLHFDHTGGLFGLVSLRYQAGYAEPLTIYGPPGIKATVDSLLQAIEPGVSAVGTMHAKGSGGPAAGLSVVELEPGSKTVVGDITVTATENTHYATLPAANRPLSFAYRFDAPGRSILFTGDTGPSENVAKLCQGVDLLVSEIMDPSLAIKHIRERRPDIPAFALPIVESHFRKEHMAPDEVGKLAAACQAKRVVLTHIPLLPDEIPGATQAIAARFGGKITFANDLDTF
ncbi:MBL fold metallo-hydrolase [Phenylobacterium sp.]|uniref:MBL fold metallo-hydrolase n=1 Tax=Phenylobacterium sp. TaxID=1871053 RepID=UPI0035B2438E